MFCRNYFSACGESALGSRFANNQVWKMARAKYLLDDPMTPLFTKSQNCSVLLTTQHTIEQSRGFYSEMEIYRERPRQASD